ncbi:hypothetical protein [Streptomyces sp. NPDC058157]|uniref:hypothetical protein n=1 Tax=Streptomyces sp. NPDC058157 TaxID=3346360 RepID=UPI0036E14A58
MTRRRSSGWSLRAGALTAALCSVLVTPAGAQDAPAPSPADGRPPAVGLPSPAAGTAAEVPAATPTGRLARSLDGVAARSYADTFSGVWVDEARSTVTLYLTRPELGAALVAAGRGQLAAHDGADVNVVVKGAKYSRAQLDAARDAVKRDATAWRHDGSVAIEQIGLLEGGGGLRIGADHPERAAALAQRVLADGSRAGKPAWAGIALADIRFDKSAPARPPAGAPRTRAAADKAFATADVGTRWNDKPAHDGGAILSVTRHEWWCTSGFAMDVPGWGRYMVTSAGCGSNGTYLYSGFQDFGPVFNRLPAIDAAIIDTRGTGGSSARVWIGENEKTYAGYEKSTPGDEVCQSGVRTGYRCQIFIGETTPVWTGEAYVDMTTACTRDGSAAFSIDDMGGPVFRWSSNPAKVISRGIMSTFFGTVDSSGTASTCVGFVPTATILQAWGATMAVG